MSVTLLITTEAKQLEFACASKLTARRLFLDVCKNLSIRETWYFGVYFLDGHGQRIWMDASKKKMGVYKPWARKLHFVAKYYPEDVEDDLIENVTIKYFFLQVRGDILKDRIYCPPDMCFLLASYAAQAKYGDYSEESVDFKTSTLLPDRVYKQYKLDESNFLENIVNLWKELRGLLREDAMLEYLKIAQKLEMFGVHYFDITNSKGTEVLLGVYSLGLSIFKKEDKLNPIINFPWSEIENLTFRGRKFTIKCVDKQSKDFVFFAGDGKINKRILNLGIGYHQQYITRRKPDTLEIIEMKEHAKNHRKLLQSQRANLMEEIKKRELMERRYQEEIRALNEAVELSNQQLAESRRMIEQLNRQLAENEAARRELETRQLDLQRMMERLEESKNLEAEEKRRLEEEIERRREEVARIQESVEAKDSETERLREQIEAAKREQEELKARQAEEAARREAERLEAERAAEVEAPETAQINLELSQQLKELQYKLEESRNASLETREDKIHRENMRDGRDKYKTLNQIRKGNTTRRVDLFENL